MPSMKAIKRRRLTVRNISQITKAMNLVATSKLQRARTNLFSLSGSLLSTFGVAYQTVKELDPDAFYDISRPLVLPNRVQEPRVKNTAYVLITSNRGLCGGYNSNVCKELVKHTRENGKNPIIIPLGKRGADFFRRRRYQMIEGYALSETPTFEDGVRLSQDIVRLYEDGTFDEVYLVYTKFVTVLALEPIIRRVLPIEPTYLRRVMNESLASGEVWEDLGFFKKPDDRDKSSLNLGMEFEPEWSGVLESLVPWYLGMFFYAAMASSILCEQAARMTSMDSATKNAGEIIDKLTLMFNRQRQSIITQEITEIVSGANALQ